MNGVVALRETVDELDGRAGVVLAALFAAVGVATVVAQQTVIEASSRITAAQQTPDSQFFVDPATIETPLSLGLSFGVAVLAVLGVAVVAEYAAVVTLRVVTGDSLGAAATRRVGRTVLVGFLVGTVVRVLVGVGLAAFLLPGVFFAVTLLFAHPAVAIDDAGAREALTTAWSLASGRRLDVAAIVSLLVVLYLTPRLVGSVVTGAPGLLLGGAVTGIGSLLSSGVVGRAYLAAKEDESREQTAAEEDPYDAPLDADDLAEPE
jgi:hypothetical protein